MIPGLIASRGREPGRRRRLAGREGRANSSGSAVSRTAGSPADATEGGCRTSSGQAPRANARTCGRGEGVGSDRVFGTGASLIHGLRSGADDGGKAFSARSSSGVRKRSGREPLATPVGFPAGARYARAAWRTVAPRRWSRWATPGRKYLNMAGAVCRKTSAETSLFLSAGSGTLRWPRAYVLGADGPDERGSQHKGADGGMSEGCFLFRSVDHRTCACRKPDSCRKTLELQEVGPVRSLACGLWCGPSLEP